MKQVGTKVQIFLAAGVMAAIFIIFVIPYFSKLESKLFPIGEKYTFVTIDEYGDKTLIGGYNYRNRMCNIKSIQLFYGDDTDNLLPVSFKFKSFPKLELGINSWSVLVDLDREFIQPDKIHLEIKHECHGFYVTETFHTFTERYFPVKTKYPSQE